LDEEEVTREGRFRAPLDRFVATPRPLDGRRSSGMARFATTETAEQAARYSDGFFVNNMFMSHAYSQWYVDFYRERYAAYGHEVSPGGIVGAGGAIYASRSGVGSSVRHRPGRTARPERVPPLPKAHRQMPVAADSRRFLRTQALLAMSA
jgi:hypothetical protein